MSIPDDTSAPGRHVHRNDLSGTVSGTVIQARDIAQLHLHGGSIGVPSPQQLPPAPVGFVNRQRELAAIAEAVGRRTSGTARVVVLHGRHGVGKSAVGRRWAHAHRAAYSDGQLYADFGALRHHGGVAVTDVLAGFLRALGLRDEIIPATFAERTALFRSRVAGRRVLLLLDDVLQAAEVQPLIPATADATVIVMSRAPLHELLVDGAALVPLGPLDSEHAASLLEAMAGTARLEDEPDAVRALTEICTGLPVALRICGAQLAQSPDRPVQWLVDRLKDDQHRLRRMPLSASRSLHDVFDEAWQALPGTAARMYPHLALMPGPRFSMQAAAAAAGIAAYDADVALNELAAAHLVESDSNGTRLHDLIGEHARATADRVLGADEQEAARRRVVAHYVRAVQAMDRAIVPDRLRLAPHADDQHSGPSFASTAAALQWFEVERANLLSVITSAADRGWHAAAWHLAEAMWIAYNNHKHPEEAREVYALGVAASRAVGQRDVEARMRQQLARALLDLGETSAAFAELGRARELAATTADARLAASITEFIGVAHIHADEPDAAIEALRDARASFAGSGYTRGVVLQDYHLGHALAQSGRNDEAVQALARAAADVDPVHDGVTHGRIQLRLGLVQLQLGALEAAREALAISIEVMRQHDAPFYVARAMEGLADVHRAAGDADTAAAQLEQTLLLLEAHGSGDAERLRARISALAA